MFNLKYPSMLRFDSEAHADPRLIHNLKSLFGLNEVPKEFYHQILAAVMVHPELKTVLPIAYELITKSDGDNKNDCERYAAKRMLRDGQRRQGW